MKTNEELQAENAYLRAACRLALDWCTGEGRYSEPGSDTIMDLAETVAPMLSSALGETTEADSQLAALLHAAANYGQDSGSDNGLRDEVLIAADAWWQAMGNKKPIDPAALAASCARLDARMVDAGILKAAPE